MRVSRSLVPLDEAHLKHGMKLRLALTHYRHITTQAMPAQFPSQPAANTCEGRASAMRHGVTPDVTRLYDRRSAVVSAVV